jgi:hypothetical protein
MRSFMEDAEFEGTLKAESLETGYIADARFVLKSTLGYPLDG